jgi:hypothetical protein
MGCQKKVLHYAIGGSRKQKNFANLDYCLNFLGVMHFSAFLLYKPRFALGRVENINVARGCRPGGGGGASGAFFFLGASDLSAALADVGAPD